MELLPWKLVSQGVESIASIVQIKDPSPDRMSQIDREAEQKKAIEVKCKTLGGKLNIVRIDDEESSSSSSMYLYNIESNEKHSEVSSQRTPTIIENQGPEQLDEVHNSPTADKN